LNAAHSKSLEATRAAAEKLGKQIQDLGEISEESFARFEQAAGQAFDRAGIKLRSLIQIASEFRVEGGGSPVFDRAGFARGGLVGFATGGLAPTDTIPAILSPGEMVINERATRGFYPILKAMNDAGLRG